MKINNPWLGSSNKKNNKNVIAEWIMHFNKDYIPHVANWILILIRLSLLTWKTVYGIKDTHTQNT